MSLEKLAQDAYTQGFTETLRNLNVPDSVKVAALNARGALLFGAGSGAYGAEEGERLMGALKGSGNLLAKTLGYGAGAGFGTSLLTGLITRNPALATRVGLSAGILGTGYGAAEGLYDNFTGDYGIFSED